MNPLLILLVFASVAVFAGMGAQLRDPRRAKVFHLVGGAAGIIAALAFALTQHQLSWPFIILFILGMIFAGRALGDWVRGRVSFKPPAQLFFLAGTFSLLGALSTLIVR